MKFLGVSDPSGHGYKNSAHTSRHFHPHSLNPGYAAVIETINEVLIFKMAIRRQGLNN